MNHNFLIFVLMAAVLLGVFSFLLVGVWARERRREREAFYRNETARRIAETQGSGGTSAMEFLRESEAVDIRRRREGQKLGGLVTIAVGVGLMVFIRVVDWNGREPGFLVGLIPTFVGVALLVYAYVLGPKDKAN